MSLTSHDRRPHPQPRRLVKPLVDRLAAALLLLLAVPWLVLIALALWLSDDGPVFERDRRTGRSGRAISLVRFRTSAWGSPEAPSVPGPVRRLLRRSNLDELPQLWNVVRGDLAFVGPRPRMWDGGEARTLPGLKPGLIGLSDPDGDRPGREELTEERYAQEWSLRLDLMLLARALRHALRRTRPC